MPFYFVLCNILYIISHCVFGKLNEDTYNFKATIHIEAYLLVLTGNFGKRSSKSFWNISTNFCWNGERQYAIVYNYCCCACILFKPVNKSHWTSVAIYWKSWHFVGAKCAFENGEIELKVSTCTCKYRIEMLYASWYWKV